MLVCERKSERCHQVQDVLDKNLGILTFRLYDWRASYMVFKPWFSLQYYEDTIIHLRGWKKCSIKKKQIDDSDWCILGTQGAFQNMSSDEKPFYQLMLVIFPLFLTVTVYVPF